MSGEWIIPAKAPHRCDLPDPTTSSSGEGGLWQCVCGKYWTGAQTSTGPEWHDIEPSLAAYLIARYNHELAAGR